MKTITLWMLWVVAVVLVAGAVHGQDVGGSLVNEEPPAPIEAANWFEEVYWGFLETIGVETPNEAQYREWKESVEDKILNQDYAVDEVKLVTAERTKDVVRTVSEPTYKTVFVKNATFEGNITEYTGQRYYNITVKEVLESWQEVITRTETYVVPKDRACIEQENNILCVSVPHCLGRYTTENVLAYVNAGCENEVIPKNALSTIQQVATKPTVYIPPTMPTKKEILLSKDTALIDKVLPKALADDVKTSVTVSP